MKLRKICFHCHTGRCYGPVSYSKLKALDICFPTASRSWLRWADHFTLVVPFCECRLRFCSFLPWSVLYMAEFLAAVCWGSSAATRQHYLPGSGCGFPKENGGFQVNWRERQKGGWAAAVCALNKSGQISSEEAGKAGRWLSAQPWERWCITRFISLLCCKGCMGSSEQNDAPFAGTLLSSPSSLPEHNGSMSVAGRVAKISDVSEKLIAARSGAGVGWSFVQPRAAGSAHCARKRKERHCCCRLGAGCRKRRILGGLAIYWVSDFSDAQQLKTWPFFSLVWWRKF